MNKSERRIHANKVRRKRERRKNIVLVMLTICLVFSLSFIANSLLANAKSNHEYATSKYYKSIMVERGDTLWSIAAEYTDSQTDTTDLIKEIKQLNNLHGDEIICGSYLVVPYFSNELIQIEELCVVEQ